MLQQSMRALLATFRYFGMSKFQGPHFGWPFQVGDIFPTVVHCISPSWGMTTSREQLQYLYVVHLFIRTTIIYYLNVVRTLFAKILVFMVTVPIGERNVFGDGLDDTGT